MASSTITQAAFRIPSITQVDLQNFQARSFGTHPAEAACQVIPGQASYEHDDGLGYYPDGVKRTLTDEQVAMFRHSEIQAILRKRRRARENSDIPQHRTVDLDAARLEQTNGVEQEPLSTAEDEDEYAHFLEREQQQMKIDIVVKKRRRSGTADRPRYKTHGEGKEAGIELTRPIAPYDGLDYSDDTPVSNPTSQVIDDQRTQLQHGRKRIVYEDEEGVDTITSTAGEEKSSILPEAKIFLWPKINN